jgi:hypothetical protein
MARHFEVNNHTYTYTHISVIEQWKLARLAAPIFDNKDKYKWISLFYQMQESDFDRIFEIILPHVQRQVSNGKGESFSKIWGIDDFIFPDITSGNVITIIVEVLVDFLPDFLKDVGLMEYPTEQETPEDSNQ